MVLETVSIPTKSSMEYFLVALPVHRDVFQMVPTDRGLPGIYRYIGIGVAEEGYHIRCICVGKRRLGGLGGYSASGIEIDIVQINSAVAVKLKLNDIREVNRGKSRQWNIHTCPAGGGHA